ncbi:MAG: flagellar hook-basal body complex protein [Roseovarius indicus]|uniref:flagellar hook-basal body complex protein n=1 Tax=Roseovarius indicus TaxID=540747 RepID=UPI0032EC8771
METAGYTTLTRQTGLLNEMQVIANNIANASTTGYRQEGLIFSEYVTGGENAPSVSMARTSAHIISMQQGALTQTGGTYDFAIEGPGFFMIETAEGERLTRAGSFSTSAEGTLVTPDGNRVLDAGGAPLFVPPDAAGFSVSADGTISADGRPLGQLGLVQPVDPLDLVRESGVMFRAEGDLEPVENGKIVQGFLENANVEPVLQITRMIEVQRAYELGQSFLDAENDRVREALRAMSRQ